MQIHWRHAKPIPEAERDAAEARIERLAEGHTDLIDCWIDVEGDSRHRHGDAGVTIRCQARGTEIVIRSHDAEPVPALRQALDSFERDVKRLRQRRSDRRSARPAPPPQLGVVDRVFGEEGYGFLLTDDGEQVYFHRNAVGNGLAFEALEEGLRVALDFERGEKGLQATFVAPAPAGVPVP